jgi:rod shape-determining protein MreD
MNTNFIRLLCYFILLVLLQDIVIDKLPLGTYIRPELYTIFILLLPFNYPAITSLIWAFALGLCIDLFSTDVIGMHAAALLVLAYVRPRLLRLVSSKDDMESIAIPSYHNLGLRTFILYTLLSIAIYNTVLFTLDTFSFHNFSHVLVRILLSTLVTTLFIILIQFAFISKRR